MLNSGSFLAPLGMTIFSIWLLCHTFFIAIVIPNVSEGSLCFSSYAYLRSFLAPLGMTIFSIWLLCHTFFIAIVIPNEVRDLFVLPPMPI
jgi:hypothetical protein